MTIIERTRCLEEYGRLSRQGLQHEEICTHLASECRAPLEVVAELISKLYPEPEIDSCASAA